MTLLDYDDMEVGQYCAIYIITESLQKYLDIGVVVNCHGLEPYGETPPIYEDFSVKLVTGETSEFYYDSDEQGVLTYSILLYTLNDAEIHQQVLLETI